MNPPFAFDGKPSRDCLEQYRDYLKVIAQSHLRTRLRTKEDESDIVQRVMLGACKDLSDFRGTSEGELKAWLAKIASNIIANVGRHYSRQRRDLVREHPLTSKREQSSTWFHRSLVDNELAPGERLILEEDCDQLVQALLQLLDDERAAIVLRYLQGWPIPDIAEHLGRSKPAVYGLLNRGFSKLRAQLSAHE